jgi:flagellin
MIQINTSFLFERQQNAQELSNRKNAQKLASAKRINHSADDAAGLSISTNMTTHIKNMDTVKRGLGQGLDYTKVAMGALNEMTDMLQRIRELGIQSMNDLLSFPSYLFAIVPNQRTLQALQQSTNTATDKATT